MEFVKKIQNFAFQNELWQKNSKILIAVSGGADSVSLLSFFAYLKPKYSLKLHIAHVNYGIRTRDADLDEKFVKKLGKKYDIPVSILNAKKTYRKSNSEEILRDIRYNFFENKRKELDFDLIAVAHNQDDQAETVLMRLIRGSGLQGMSSMKAKNGFIIRPLLKTSREEILTYLKKNKLSYRTDKSNKDVKFLRNKIRNQLIPYLEKKYNPSFRYTISNAAFSIAQDYALLEELSKNKMKVIPISEGIIFNAKEFLTLESSLAKIIIRREIEKLRGNLFNFGSGQMNEFLKILKGGRGKNQKASFGGLNIRKKGDIVQISLK